MLRGSMHDLIYQSLNIRHHWNRAYVTLDCVIGVTEALDRGVRQVIVTAAKLFWNLNDRKGQGVCPFPFSLHPHLVWLLQQTVL